jgi:tetratricopeptide (TPR) repeat protein
MGYYGKAYEMYSRANDMDRQTNLSNRGVNLYNLGMYHLNVAGEYDKALGFFESAIKAYPGYWPAYHDAAICFILKGDPGEAGRRLVAALRLWPDNAELQHSLGFVMLKLGELDLAIKHARLALSINPELHNAWSVVGEASRRMGKYGMATTCWEKYTEKKPDDLEANFALLELYSMKNNKSGMMRTIGKLISLKGDQGWSKAAELLVKHPELQVRVPELERIKAIINSNLCEPGGR